MNFDESELVGAAMIGFDMIEGPEIKWYRQFQDCEFQIDMESFLMNFYLSFRGGDEELQPLAILYDGFYVVAFPRGLELCCLFLKPDNLEPKLSRLHQIAYELILHMDDEADKGPEQPTTEDQDYEEIKRIVINLLQNQEISTPELRRYFKLTNSEIWKIMSQLENDHVVMRTQKRGRTQFWTVA